MSPLGQGDTPPEISMCRPLTRVTKWRLVQILVDRTSFAQSFQDLFLFRG